MREEAVKAYECEDGPSNLPGPSTDEGKVRIARKAEYCPNTEKKKSRI